MLYHLWRFILDLLKKHLLDSSSDDQEGTSWGTGVENTDYIRYTVADLHGRAKGRVLPVGQALMHFASGVSVFGGVLLYNSRNDKVPTSKDDPTCDRIPRAIIKPDMETIYRIPWCSGEKFQVAEVLCESYWLKDKTPQLACPRYVARQQLQKLKHHGLKLLSGFEIEFFFNKDNCQLSSQRNYMSQREQAKHSDFIFEVERQMQLSGVGIESLHCEEDANSFEASLAPVGGIRSADSGFKFTNNIQEIADKCNYNISFSPNQGDVHVGVQFNHSLWSISEDRNVFNGKNGLSDTGKYWLAGLMKHAKALTVLFCPTIGCYGRLHQHHRPSFVFWGFAEISACVKIKHFNSKRGIYLENRIPSSMSNPYLVLAATVAAGLDGVIRRLDCPPSGRNSMSECLPHTLSEALQELLVDTAMTEHLGQEFVDWFAATIRSDISASTD